MKPELLTITYKNSCKPKEPSDIRHVARSLAAMADLLEESYREGCFSELSLDVVFREYRRGSDVFDICIQAGAQVAPLLAPSLPLLPNVLGILGLVKGELPGMLQFLNWQKEHPDSTKESEENGKIILTAPDSKITITNTVYKIANSTVMLQAAQDVAEPLANELTAITVNSSNTEGVPVTKRELSSIKRALLVKKDEFENAYTDKLWIIVARPSLTGGEQWYFKESSESREFGAKVKDINFLDRVVSGMPFGNGDMLKVIMQTKQNMSEKGNLVTKRSVLKVLQIKHRTEQGTLIKT
ncbi:hypothetical protein [Halodesulfovibrio sp.]|uniref:hypothetical protein n=1 Tax=Halodesulfovibrio sp. TaxID=1912772 RepID=UPI0025BF966A|nr:hypothetical protein [Halodesulfovibrio sp.]